MEAVYLTHSFIIINQYNTAKVSKTKIEWLNFVVHLQ